ncbi:MAG: indole-3-glycerol phosphate synthase TrpC [Clostridiales bacterium]|nr:indole-3-glycerol phosphate synthase TrpC [Clostridiales bacterium]
MILEKIAEDTKKRVLESKEAVSFERMKEQAETLSQKEWEENGKRFFFPFEQALKKPDISFICEVKKASPSKGIIAESFDYVKIAKEYEKAGASAISVLTEPKYFLGDNRYLTEISKEVSLPLLRKDFVVDVYQIYEAKVIGASAVLLICEITEEKQLMEYLETAHRLGLSALVEAHTKEQIDKAVRQGARIIGANNRDLTNFQVDVDTAKRLRHLVPEEVLFVSESGIKTPEDIAHLREAGADAVLIGETLMKSEDKTKTLQWLKG